MKNASGLVVVLIVSTLLAVFVMAMLGGPSQAFAAVPSTGAPTSDAASLAFIAAAAATALATLGAGFAVAKVGAAAIGALAEKPELFGRLLIFIGLAEGIAIYGLIVSILILNRLA